MTVAGFVADQADAGAAAPGHAQELGHALVKRGVPDIAAIDLALQAHPVGFVLRPRQQKRLHIGLAAQAVSGRQQADFLADRSKDAVVVDDGVVDVDADMQSAHRDDSA